MSSTAPVSFYQDSSVLLLARERTHILKEEERNHKNILFVYSNISKGLLFQEVALYLCSCKGMCFIYSHVFTTSIIMTG